MNSPRVAVHIGYHKTATTWLQREILPRHPQIRSFVSGSPHASPLLQEVIGRPDREFDAGRARQVYEARVAELGVPDGGVVVISAERLSGHAATGGYDTFRIAHRLHSVVPEARVFLAVREQVAMIESEYRQLVLEGTPARLATLLARVPSWVNVGFDLGHYEYDLLADEYARCFGKDRVGVFSFEAITADPAVYLAALASFLELDPWPALPASVLRSRVNAGLPSRLVGVRRVLNHFQRSPLNPNPLIALRPVWRSPLSALASRLPARRRSLIDTATQQQLRDRYRESNHRLAARYGVSFPGAER
ncbi:MAG: hypothetical protein ACXVLO_05975 [Acidimicrobiia bacterium]